MFNVCSHCGAYVVEKEIHPSSADRALAARLKARPAWRESGDSQFIDAMLAYNAWFRQQAAQSESPLELLDTTRQSLPETVDSVLAWLAARRIT